MQETRYFSHAWALLTKDKGWPKVIVMLALWMLIPIVGWLWVLGYEAEWARLIAWGVEGSPKQKNINLSQCLTSGWRVFVAQFGWGVLWTMFYCFTLLGTGTLHFYSFYPYISVDNGSFMSFLANIVGICYWVFLVIAGVRTTIYQSYTAGYQLNRIFDMLKRDIGGFVKIVGINLLSILISGAVIGVLSFFAGLLGILGLGLLSYGMASGTSHFVPAFITLLAIVLYILAVDIILLVLRLICYVMVGLWLRQFDVLSWGASGDPLPASPWLGQGSMPVQPGQAQVPQQAFTMGDPVAPIAPMTPQAEMNQNGSVPAPANMTSTSATPVSPASPYQPAMPYGSPVATPAPMTDAPAPPLSSSFEPVGITPLSRPSAPSNSGQIDGLASSVESTLLYGGDLTQQSSQTTDAKTLQTPEGIQGDGGIQADTHVGAQTRGQKSPSAEASEEAGENDPASV